MIKIGILTLNGYINYGNRLQNYALKGILEDKLTLNSSVKTVMNETMRNIDVEKSKSLKEKILKSNMSEKISWLNLKVKNYKERKINDLRINNFKKFSGKYLNEMEYSIRENNIKEEFINEFDYFISGSDQVWNPNDNKVSSVSFMTFAPKEKRLTYAPSFGVSEIPNEYKEDYTKWLNGIDNISVREEAGAKIIKDLTGKDALVVVDPTMLLTKKEWLSISKVHENKPKEKYLLTYFLGEIPKDIKKKIKSISKNNKLKVVNLAQIKDSKYYLADPSEFIDYINDAEIFVTDSFHGCVFSLLMDTALVVCDRVGETSVTSMSSRIETFVNKFYIQDRQFNNVSDEALFKTNYKKAYEVLEVERKKSFDYLESILKVKVEK